MGARINDINLESLIREGSGNRAFRFPRSKKPLTDFLRPYVNNMLNNFLKRAVFPIALTLTGLVIVSCMVLYSFIKADLEKDTIKHEANLADTIIKSTRYSMLKSDRETLFMTIIAIGSQEDVEHVRIFNKKGQECITMSGALCRCGKSSKKPFCDSKQQCGGC